MKGIIQLAPKPGQHWDTERLTTAKTLYTKISNPLGKMLLITEADQISRSTERYFRVPTEHGATKLVLAIELYQKRHGVLPESLHVLRSENLLEKIPVDPFSNRPFNYSKSRQIIWSVGEDGVDNHGEENKTARWTGKDTVFHLDHEIAK
jgi:hypothetical protein